MIRVWDPVVRLFHWGLAACFALAWLTAEEVQGAHEVIGYAAAALVALRVVWGIVGSPYARFAQFVRGPGAVVGYLRDMASGRERRHIGHNPAGAAMTVALLLSMAGTAWTGWLMAEPERQALLPAVVAPAFADDHHKGEGHEEGPVKELHEALANLMLFLVVLHHQPRLAGQLDVERLGARGPAPHVDVADLIRQDAARAMDLTGERDRLAPDAQASVRDQLVRPPVAARTRGPADHRARPPGGRERTALATGRVPRENHPRDGFLIRVTSARTLRATERIMGPTRSRSCAAAPWTWPGATRRRARCRSD